MDESAALSLVFARNAFYKRLHYLALAAFALTLFIIGFLIWVISYLVTNPTQPLYFATDTIGRLIQIVPVNTPNMTPPEVISWTTEAVERSLSYDFVNYRAQLQDAEKYFTNYGWNNYMKALRSSNNLIALTQRKLVVTTKVVGTPKLVTQGILGKAYAWKFEIPVLVTYSPPPYDTASKYANALNVSVIVQRQQILQGYKGMGVVQLVANIAETAPPQLQVNSTAPNG